MRVRTVKARVTLGLAVLKHILLTPFVGGSRGPKSWLKRLAAEDLARTPEGAWQYLEGTSRCIGCGLCDTVAVGDEAPSSWIMGEARRPADAELAVDRSVRLRQLADSIARVCPARVPAESIAQLLDDTVDVLRGARGGGR